ncbi:cilia- and flagella-associated protein 97 isoform 2-T2 [Pelodytes ibericus]
MDRYGDLLYDGNVDHSFFDSDVDETANKEAVSSLQPSQQVHGKNKVESKAEIKIGDIDRSEQGVSMEETDKKAKTPTSDHKISDSVSSLVANRPSSAVRSGRSSVQGLKIETTIPTGMPQIRKEFEDNYYPDEDDSSEEESHNSRPKSSKQTNISKKNLGKYGRDLPSSSISSSDTEYSDAGSDDRTSKSSCQSSKEKYLPQHYRDSKSSRTSVRDLRDYAEESEDTVTDVTPLSTPDISPIQSFDLAATSDALKSKVKRQENVSQDIYDPELDQKSNSKFLQDAMDLNNLLKAFMHLDKKDKQNLLAEHPSMKHKKNYSFSNEEVRRIDRENQRLLRELSRQAPKPCTKSFTPRIPSATPSRLYHTALNRQKEQQRIERDNMALLKRLESVKPTVGITRSEQLMDYQRQAGYLSSTATSPRPGKSSVSRIKPSSGGFSRMSNTGSERTGSSAALLRPTKSSNARAAWM